MALPRGVSKVQAEALHDAAADVYDAGQFAGLSSDEEGVSELRDVIDMVDDWLDGEAD